MQTQPDPTREYVLDEPAYRRADDVMRAKIICADIDICCACGRLSALYRDDVDDFLGIARMASFDGETWECGHCHFPNEVEPPERIAA